MLNGNYVDSNFLGTGERIAVELNAGAYSKVYTVQHTNPYTTIDNLPRTESLTYRDVTQFVSASSTFSSQTVSHRADLGVSDHRVPVLPLRRHASTAASCSPIAQQRPPGAAVGAAERPSLQRAWHTIDREQQRVRVLRHATSRTEEAVAGWDWDTRNRTLFADRGMRMSLSSSVTAPCSDVKYWIGNYEFIKYVPLWHGLTLSFLEGIDYGAPLGNTTALPPYRQFFGGGPDNVRGFRESRLGPKDQFGNPYGGNMRITSQNELIFPMPGKYAQTARVSAFFDMGDIYQTGTNIKFYGPDGVTPESYSLRAPGTEALGGRRGAVAGPPGTVPLQSRCAAERQAAATASPPGATRREGFQFSVGKLSSAGRPAPARAKNRAAGPVLKPY